MDLKIYSNQLENLLSKYCEMVSKSQFRDLSDLPKVDRRSLVTSSIAAVHRITGEKSAYSREILRIQKNAPKLHLHTSDVLGVVKSLKDDIDNGYIKSLVELIHGDIFSDFIDMASHLISKGYKDAAAIITGSTLENHLKQLATKNEIPLIGSNGKPKKASTINVDLVKANVYQKLDQKNITAWLDIRNKAAHGNYSEYNSDQVKLLISSVQDFITRKPA